VAVEERAVAVQVLLPLVLAAAYGVEHAEPGGPVAVHDGYVSQDLAGADVRSLVLWREDLHG